MPPYAYPIKINHKRIELPDAREYDLPQHLTLEYLQSIMQKDEYIFINYEDAKIEILGTRLESEAERDARVRREEAYMKEYNRRQLLKQFPPPPKSI